MLHVFMLRTHVLEFQSAPGREAGRCSQAHLLQAIFVLFQSAPGREAGRCNVDTCSAVWVFVVSIRARP